MSSTGQLTVPYQIGCYELEVTFHYKVTSRARPATGPSWDSGGEPAEPMEYQVTKLLSLTEENGYDCPEIMKVLDMWIRGDLETRDDVYEAIEQDLGEF